MEMQQNSLHLNRYQLDPRGCDVFDPTSTAELNPEVLT